MSTVTYTIDEGTGEISLSQPLSISGAWGSANISDLGGNSDPVLLFAGNSINNTDADILFRFGTATPILLSGPVRAQSRLLYNLSSQQGFGPAQLRLFNNPVLTARDLVLGGGFVNKGIDNGGPCDAADGSTQPCDNLTVNGHPFGDSSDTFTLMAVNIDYFLSAHSSASFNGHVIQNIVPEPATYALLAAGLAMVGFVVRRRLNG